MENKTEVMKALEEFYDKNLHSFEHPKELYDSRMKFMGEMDIQEAFRLVYTWGCINGERQGKESQLQDIWRALGIRQ